MPKTIQNRREATAWQQHFDDAAPQVGDPAPDFELSDVNGKNTVALSQFRKKKPVALIFGSYT